MHVLRELQSHITQRIAEVNFQDSPVELYSPINYIMSLGGKRLRPALCLLACDMFGGKIEEALDPAIGIEIFHNFTLVHDDIMDNAPIRRGKSTVHIKWNPNIAILSGDTMMAYAYEYIMKSPEAVRSEIFSAFNKTAIQVCEGQQYDMNFELRNDVSIDEYIEMIRLKTAVLLAVSLKMGALIGGASSHKADILYTFGEKLGIAFQLKDDLLDVYSDEDKFGKTVGGDIKANKKTFLYLKALLLGDPFQQEKLRNLFSDGEVNPDEKVKQVKKIYEALDIKRHTNLEIDSYYQEAKKSLAQLDLSESRKSELLGFAGQLKMREL